MTAYILINEYRGKAVMIIIAVALTAIVFWLLGRDDTLIEFDLDKIKEAEFDVTTMMIVTEYNNDKLTFPKVTGENNTATLANA